MNDRKKLLVSTLTLSLWAHLRADEDAFRNPTYRKYNEVRLECTIFSTGTVFNDNIPKTFLQ